MKLRTMIFAVSLFFAGASLHAQTVHALSPNTRGNQLSLTIANVSDTTAAKELEVSVAGHSSAIFFTTERQVIQWIAPKSMSTVSFRFDVARTAPVNGRDTLEFLISDKRGTTWKKSIIVTYTPPTTFRLEQNYPNPFNPLTKIEYQLPVEARVTLKVYDILGREVKTLLDEERPAGFHTMEWDGKNDTNSRVSSGVYFYRMEASNAKGERFSQVKKLILLR